MKKIVIAICSIMPLISIAETESCNPPTVQTITLIKQGSKDSQLVYFGGRYNIQLHTPAKVIFSRDMLSYFYSKDKYITLHADSMMTKTNKNQYLAAFGLQKSVNQDSIYLRKGLSICNSLITQYKIQSMDETIIAIQNKINNKPNTMVYLFNEIPPLIELIQFTGFSNDAIKISLSTLSKIKR